jgi:hypothetical protein
MRQGWIPSNPRRPGGIKERKRCVVLAGPRTAGSELPQNRGADEWTDRPTTTSSSHQSRERSDYVVVSVVVVVEERMQRAATSTLTPSPCY